MPASPSKKKKTDPRAELESIGLEMGNKPPQALEFEKNVLGAMLIEPACVDQAMEGLNSGCFYDPRHKIIFQAISRLYAEHSPIDMLTVSNELDAHGQLDDAGGLQLLSELSSRIASSAHVEYNIGILKQKAIQRDLITASREILRDSFDDSIKVDDLIDSSQSRIFNAIQNNAQKDVQEIGAVINQTLSDIEKLQSVTGLSGVPSGYETIDRVTQGWQPSDLIILAARPSVGKTAFSLNIARNAAVKHHYPVAFFSLEMSAKQLAKRLMTAESGLSAEKIKGGSKMEDFEWVQLETKLHDLIKSPLYIDDTPSLPIMEFRTKLKSLVKNKGVRLAIVDYLQLMQGPSELRGMREQEVASISHALKATAKELDIPIIALSQLSRNAVQRNGSTGRPLLSDLRESGSIEQDADMVIFIHRPDYLGLTENADDKEKTQIIIAKHRNGQTCDIDMLFKSDQVKFVEVQDALSAKATMYHPSAMNAEAENVPAPAASDEIPGAGDAFAASDDAFPAAGDGF